MVRTQVQLTEAQAEKLKSVAAANGVSVSELVRRAVQNLIEEQVAISGAGRRERARAAAGRFASGSADGAGRHDEHLAAAFRE